MSRRQFMNNGSNTNTPPIDARGGVGGGGGGGSGGAGSAAITNNQSQCFAQQNKHLSKMLENEKQEKRRLHDKISDFQDTIESQKKMIERLRENRRADPALQGSESGAVARCKSDASFAQARLQESEVTLKLRDNQIKKLQKEIEKERQRGDFAEKETMRVETDAKKARERNDNAKYKELYHKIRDHLMDSRQASDESRIKHLEAKVVELELQLMNPEKEELASTIRRMETKLDEEEKKKEKLQLYILEVQKQLTEVHSDLEASTRELTDAQKRLQASELSERDARRKWAASESAKELVVAEFDAFKRSVQDTLGDLSDNLEEVGVVGALGGGRVVGGGRGGGGGGRGGADDEDEEELRVEDLEHIDHRELEEFLKNF